MIRVWKIIMIFLAEWETLDGEFIALGPKSYLAYDEEKDNYKAWFEIFFNITVFIIIDYNL